MTTTGAILGEYRTVSDSTPCAKSSRTTVGVDGSVWVGHRGATGQVTNVGLVETNSCVDRNGNGTIETSTGYGNVLAWPGVNAPVSAPVDECILHHINTGSSLWDAPGGASSATTRAARGPGPYPAASSAPPCQRKQGPC